MFEDTDMVFLRHLTAQPYVWGSRPASVAMHRQIGRLIDEGYCTLLPDQPGQVYSRVGLTEQGFALVAAYIKRQPRQLTLA